MENGKYCNASRNTVNHSMSMEVGNDVKIIRITLLLNSNLMMTVTMTVTERIAFINFEELGAF